MTEAQADEKSEVESDRLMQLFMDRLDVDEEVATILIQEGFSGIEEVAYIPEAEMIEIEEFDESIARELQSRARDVLLAREIASEEGLSDQPPAEDLLALEGMDDELATQLARHGIATREDLAEQAVPDVLDVVEISEERAGELIMAARAVWFEEANEAEQPEDGADSAPAVSSSQG